MMARNLRVRRPSRVNPQVSPPEELEEEYVTTEGDTPPPSGVGSSQDHLRSSKSTRILSKSLKRNPVVPTRSSPRLHACQIGGAAASRQRNQMDTTSEASDPGLSTPNGYWETQEAARIPLPPPEATPPRRYRTPKSRSSGRRHEVMGGSRAFMASGESFKGRAADFNEVCSSEEERPDRKEPAYSGRKRGGGVGRKVHVFSNPLYRYWWKIIRILFTWVFIIYVAAVLIAYTGRQTTKAFVSGLTALCTIPGVIEFELLPFCKAPRSEWDVSDSLGRRPLPSAWNFFTGPRYPPPNFRQLIDVQNGYSFILEKTEVGAIAAIHLIAAHISLTDLSTVVGQSKLESKTKIALQLSQFADDAKSAARDFTRFQNSVEIEIDFILVVNDLTLQRLKEAKERESGMKSGLMGLILAPFRIAEMEALQKEVRHIFLRALQKVENGLRDLVNKAELLVVSLENLDDKLIKLHKTVVEADGKYADDQEKILESLWSRFYHWRNLKLYESHRKQLEEVTIYRGIARNQVKETLQDLQNMLANLAGLRTVVTESMSDKQESEKGQNNTQRQQSEKINVGNIPLEVYIEVVEKGTERLMKGRVRGAERFKEDMERAKEGELRRIREGEMGEKTERIGGRRARGYSGSDSDSA